MYVYEKLSRYKRSAKAAARDFHYDRSIFAEIDAAKSEDEVSAIMRRYRIQKFEPEEKGVASDKLLLTRSPLSSGKGAYRGILSGVKLG